MRTDMKKAFVLARAKLGLMALVFAGSLACRAGAMTEEEMEQAVS
jgi:hypothetical protein